MKVMTPHSIPVFLGTSGIGSQFGKPQPQIVDFDAFFRDPIVVGFHVIGAPPKKEDALGLLVFGGEENAPQVVGFFSFESGLPINAGVGLFANPSEEEELGPQVLGFFSFAVAEPKAPIAQFTVQFSDEENAPQVVGFFAMEVT